MANKISDFISNFGGGFRPNRFRVSGSFGGSSSSTTMTYHIRSSTLPSSSLNTIAVPYRGRSFKMPGNRSYSAWAITVLDDNETNGTALWKKFHDWSELFNDHTTNLTSTNNLNFTDKMSIWDVYQMDIKGVDSKHIKLYGCWPSEVGPILLNMEDDQTLSTFNVTLEYTYFEVIKG
jgi:hypothetical protein